MKICEDVVITKELSANKLIKVDGSWNEAYKAFENSDLQNFNKYE